MPQKPAAAPTEKPPSDFEEDTLLPPPAPGLLAPEHDPPHGVLLDGQSSDSHLPQPDQAAVPEHVVDVPTMQGFLASRPAPDIDPLAAQSGDAIAAVLAELPVDRTQRMPLFVPSRARSDETPVEHLVGAHHGLAPSALTQELSPIDPSATVELPQVPRSLTVRFPTVLPTATGPLPPVSPSETMKLSPVPSSQTMRFPTLAPQSRVPPVSAVPITAPRSFEGETDSELPPVHDPGRGETTAEIARAALSAAATVEMPAVLLEDGENALSHSTRSLPKISLPPPSEDTLPPLPLLPPADTFFGRLAYAVSGLRSLWRRRTQIRRLRGDLADRLSAYDRALIQLGELAYSENVELLRDAPASDVGDHSDLPVSKEAALLRIQSAAQRFWAKAQKEQRSLARKEAVLASELRVLRHRRDELYQRLLLLATDPHSAEASGDERFSVGNELTGIEADRQKVATRLGEVRSSLRLLRRQNHQLKSRREQLLYALSLEYAESVRRSPHLLVLGALTAAFRPQPHFGKDKRARFESLYALLDALRGGIGKVETRLALLDGDRRAADQQAFKSTLILFGAVVLSFLMVLVGVLFYLLTA